MPRRVRPRRRSAYQKCIAKELRGKSFKSRQVARRAFSTAVRKCRKLIHKKGRKGSRRRRHPRHGRLHSKRRGYR